MPEISAQQSAEEDDVVSEIVGQHRRRIGW
jgi:hypothetical protein